jgi:glycosyltransferase involved in cell wall biosynthesis
MSENVLIIGSVWPEPDSSAAGSRMMQLIELFQSQNWQITFASIASPSEFMFDIESIGVKKECIHLNNHTFDDFIKKLQPSMVVFDRFMTEEQFGWRVAEHCPKALRILDTEDLHLLRYARQNAHKQNRNFELDDLLREDIAKREIASILRSDLTLIISTYEMDLLKSVFKIDSDLIYYLPFMLDNISQDDFIKMPSYEERRHFVSIGNFLHEPNLDAVQYLKKDIWPLIRKQLPEAELHIYGAYPSQKVFELHNEKEGFIIKGRAQDANQVIGNARLLLAPIRFGAGLKGKLVHAMLCGTPSITTPIGAEAMHENLPWSGSISNDIQEFCKSAANLYSGKEEWLLAQQKGLVIINLCYNKQVFGQALLQRINELQENLVQHRLHNFMGLLLQHHAMSSTKYMSKWIEAKNENLNKM